MKISFFIFFLFQNIYFYSQTFQNINKFSNYIGKSFTDFERDLRLRKSGAKVRLGLENRTYDFKNYFILVSENDDSKQIGKFSLYSNDSKDHMEKWYRIVSEMDKDKEYTFLRSFVADPEDKITSNSLNYNELIKLLRNSYKTENWIFEVIYKKESKFFKISCTPVDINVIIQNKPYD